jgi:hypothetical protein
MALKRLMASGTPSTALPTWTMKPKLRLMQTKPRQYATKETASSLKQTGASEVI